MVAAYTHATLQDLIDQTLQELADPTGTFYLSQEVQFNLLEALTVWNMLTGWNRATEYFSTTPGQALYDLEVVLGNDPLGKVSTVRDTLGRMQYRLMEPYDPIASAGISEMFTHSSLVRNIQQRRDRFLAETETVVVIKAPIIVPGVGDGVIPLDDHTISIARAVFRTDDNRYYLLEPTDESVATAYIPSWRQSAGIPKTISLVMQPQLNAQLIPPPSGPGTLYLLTVESGATLDTTANTLLGVVEDTAWGLVWGAMADALMRDGIGRAPALAEFCLQMYDLCVQLSRQLPAVLGVLINNQMISPVPDLTMLDAMRPGWQGQSYSTPRTPALIGNILALQPVPDDIYSIGVVLIRKTPVPGVGDRVQLGREQLAAIVAWAKQLCLFKKGGTQLQEGIRAAQALFNQARIYNEERIQSSAYLTELYDFSSPDSWVPLRTRSSDTGVEADGGGDARDTASSRQPRAPRSTRKLGGR